MDVSVQVILCQNPWFYHQWAENMTKRFCRDDPKHWLQVLKGGFQILAWELKLFFDISYSLDIFTNCVFHFYKTSRDIKKWFKLKYLVLLIENFIGILTWKAKTIILLMQGFEPGFKDETCTPTQPVESP